MAAANSIFKLKVETSEYDQKLANAAKGIRHLADVAHQSDGDLTGLEKSTLDYIKAVGEMETKSRSAAGQVRELESTYKELKVIYDQLNDVEKADEGGKALAASLDQIKQRAQEARAQLDTASKSLNDNGQSAQQSGGILESLAGKFTLNIDALKLLDMGLSATKAALDVAKDAFFSTEGNIDEWGRTVKGAEGAYDVFLQTLNNGNWSNFFSNLQTAIQGARDLYDSLDRLGSIKSNNQAAIAIQQQQVQQLRLMKQQGQNVDDQLKAATERLAALQKQGVSAGMAAGSQSAFQTIRNGVNSVGGAGINDATIKYAVDRIMKGGQGEFDKYARNYEILQQKGMVTRTQTINDSQGGTYERQYKVFDINALTKEQQKQYALAKTITDRETEIQKGISLYAQAVNEGAAAAREELRGNRYALQGSGGSGGKGGKTTKEDIKYADDSIMAQEKLISDLTQKWKTAAGAVRDDYAEQLDAAKAKLKEMTDDPLKELENGFENNYNTGYEGSRQAKEDGIRGDFGNMREAFANAPISTQGVEQFISETKSLLSQADLGSELYTQLSDQLKDATTMSTLLQELMERGMAGADLENTAQALKEKLLSPEGIDQEAVQAWLDQLNKQIEEAGGVGLKLNSETGEVSDDKKKSDADLTTAINKATIGVNALSSINSGLKGMGIDLGDDIGNAISIVQSMMTVIQGVQAIVSLFQTPAIVTNTVALNTLTATLIAKSFLPGFTNGGIVPAFAQGGLIGRAAAGMMIPGNSMSGDRLRLPVDGGRGMIGVNSGELILNRAQQGVIAQELEGGSFDNIQLDARVSAEDIIFILNNNANRRGYRPFIND